MAGEGRGCDGCSDTARQREKNSETVGARGGDGTKKNDTGRIKQNHYHWLKWREVNYPAEWHTSDHQYTNITALHTLMSGYKREIHSHDDLTEIEM